MNDELDLANWLHEESCVSINCPRYYPGGKHRDYYLEMAERVWARLEPVIGAANILPVVKILLDEIMLSVDIQLFIAVW